MKPLPLTNGALFIDNSSIESLQSCARAFEYNRLEKRIATGEKPSLNFGSAVHLALEWRYKNCRNAAPTIIDEEQQSSIINDFFNLHPVDGEEHRNVNHAIEVVQRYNQRYNLEPFNVLVDDKGEPMVELSFALPLFKHNYVPIIYTGRIDLPVSWDGQIIIVDHKTTSMMGNQFFEEQKMSYQPLGYCYAFEKLTGMPVSGYCVNGIRTKTPPAKPRNGTLEDWWNEGFGRDVTYLALRPTWREEWLRHVQSMVEYLFWLHSKGEFPMTGMFVRNCARYGGCQYKDVCMLAEDKRKDMLMSPVYTDNLWTPLRQENKKEQEPTK